MFRRRLVVFSQHTSADDGRGQVSSRSSRSSRCKNSPAAADEAPHIGSYRLLKTIGKGNFAKVKLARHVLTGREVRETQEEQEEEQAALPLSFTSLLSLLSDFYVPPMAQDVVPPSPQ